MAKNDALERQIAECRRVLESYLDGQPRFVRFDRRIGHFLSRKGVTTAVYSWASRGGDYTDYELNTRPDGTLKADAFSWLAEHGLGELASQFDRVRFSKYAHGRLTELERARAEAAEKLAKIDAEIECIGEKLADFG